MFIIALYILNWNDLFLDCRVHSWFLRVLNCFEIIKHCNFSFHFYFELLTWHFLIWQNNFRVNILYVYFSMLNFWFNLFWLNHNKLVGYVFASASARLVVEEHLLLRTHTRRRWNVASCAVIFLLTLWGQHLHSLIKATPLLRAQGITSIE